MQALAIYLRQLTEAGGPDLRLTPGRAIMARVMAADGNGRGVLNIAGVAIEAQIPPEVRAGESLRLLVRALDSHRVVLSLPHEDTHPLPAGAPGAAEPPPTPPLIPLPGGAGLARVDAEATETGRHGVNAAGVSALSLRYDGPSLGALDLRFTLDAGSLRLQVAAGAGPGYALTREHADALALTLERALGRSATVTVVPRREPLDIYA